MAKKFVRGITDVKTINNQDFDTNNVNDLLSDGQYNYIHRKKGKDEEYHNLTDNLKTLSSDNTELLSVTNNNKTTNTATLHPKHDAQKEQVLESTRNTISIHHGTNGTAEKTTVDTNPQKVLEHENLLNGYGISKKTTGNTTKLGLEYTRVQDGYDLNLLLNGCVRAGKFLNAPQENTWFFVTAFTEGEYTVQHAISLTNPTNQSFTRLLANNVWGSWREQVGDKSVIDGLLAKKEQLLESTRNTISIHHGENGTAEKTTVDTNPQKVLEHENLLNGYGISKKTTGNTTKLGLEYTRVPDGYDLNLLLNGCVRGDKFLNAPQENTWFFVSGYSEGDYTIQEAITLLDGKNTTYRRTRQDGDWGSWREQVGDKSTIDDLLSQKQDVLTAGTGITIQDNVISASAPVEGATVSIQNFSTSDFYAYEHVVTIGQQTLTTFSFECYDEITEHVISGELKEELQKFIGTGYSVTNGALSISHEVDVMKLLKSSADSHIVQQATFTFYRKTGGAGTV